MHFEFTEAEEQFRKEVREFFDEIWPPELRRTSGLGSGPTPPEEVDRFRKALSERGWMTLGWPAEYGGHGDFTPIERFILSTEASAIGAPLSFYNVNIMGPLIIKYGTDWMKREVLPGIADGSIDFVLGFTEPETGSDLANLQTKAVREGDEYVINGQKMYGNPGPGDIIYLAVRTDPDAPLRDGISLIFVEHGTEGLTVTQMPTLGGSNVGATFYDNLRVPADHLLGEENRGWDYVREALDLDRSSGIPYGHIPVLADEIIKFVKNTTVNGKPLADDPWVRDRVAQLVLEVDAGQAFQGMTASKIAAGLKLRTESSIQKIFMTELERRLGEFGMEIAGPVANVRSGSEHAPANGFFSDTFYGNPGITIAGGSNEIQRNIIAVQGLGLPRG